MTIIPAPGADLATVEQIDIRALFEKLTAAKYKPEVARGLHLKNPDGSFQVSSIEMSFRDWRDGYRAASLAAVPASEPPQPLHVMAPFAPPAGQQDADYVEIAHLIGAIYFAGDFVAETFNERALESLLIKTGHRYKSWEEVAEATPAPSSAQARGEQDKIVCTYPTYAALPPCAECAKAGRCLQAADPVSGMPDLSSLQRYRPTVDRHHADFPPGPMEQHARGDYVRFADVERLLNPQVKEDAKK